MKAIGRLLYVAGVWIVGFIIGFVIATAIGSLILTACDALQLF